MKNLYVLFGSIVVLCCLSGCAKTEMDKIDKGINIDIAKIKAEIDQLVENDDFSGCILLNDKDKNTIFSYFCGYASKEYEVKNTLDTKFKIASISKSITGITITKLIEHGKIDPSKFVSEYINTKNSIYNQITIEHLLTHTSGLGPFMQALDTSNNKTYENLSDYMDYVENATLEFTPGEKWGYSNLGYLILGLVVENITGMTYRSHVEQEIFVPANMTNSGFWLDSEVIKNRATSYAYDDENGIWRSRYSSFRGDPSWGMYSTVTDLSNFMNAVLGNTFLSKSFTDMAITPKPELNSPFYGYGFNISDEKIAHGGNWSGFSSQMTHYKSTGYTLVVLCNYPNNSRILSFGAQEVHKIFDKYIL